MKTMIKIQVSRKQLHDCRHDLVNSIDKGTYVKFYSDKINVLNAVMCGDIGDAYDRLWLVANDGKPIRMEVCTPDFPLNDCWAEYSLYGGGIDVVKEKAVQGSGSV